MTQYIWNGGAAGDFDDPDNWSPKGVPGAGDIAVDGSPGTALTINIEGETVEDFSGGGAPNDQVADDNTFFAASSAESVGGLT